MKFGLQIGNFSLGNIGSGILEQNISDYNNGANFFIPLNGHGDTVYYECRNEKEFLIAYNLCSPLKSIIGKRAKAFNNGKLEILKKSDNNYAKGQYAEDIKKLIQNPNPLQTQKQFFSQQNHYIDIFGYCPVLRVRPVGMPNEISSIWNIPPYLINDLDFTGKWLKQKNISDIFRKLTITWNGDTEELPLDDIYFVFDDGIGTDIDTNLNIPDSRLIGNEYPISNIIAAYKSRNTLITKRGAIGILSNDSKDQAGTIPLPEGEKDAVQKEFRQYGLTGQPKQVIITDAALKWQQMGFSTKDLLLFEEIEDDISRLCDSYGYPVELIASTKQTSYENKRQAKKSLYRDAIIPESESRMEQNSRGILDPTKGFYMIFDFSDVDVIQEEQKEKAEARRLTDEAFKIEYDNGLITKNDWREGLGLDRLPIEEFNQYKEINSTNESTPQDTTA